MTEHTQMRQALDQLLREFEAGLDLTEAEAEAAHDRRYPLALAAVDYRFSRLRLGEAMYRYRQAAKHGDWGLVLAAITKVTKIAGRTLSEVMADFERVKDEPATILAAMQDAGLDPAKKKNADVIQMIKVEVEKGAEPVEAVKTVQVQVQQDKTAARKLKVVAEPEKTLTQYTDDFARSLALALRKIPAKDQITVWRNASASVLWLAGQRGPVTIIPGLRLAGSTPKQGTVIPAEQEVVSG